MPSLSVLMPVRNAAPWLAAAVHSIQRQTCRDWELLAIDDGSTDDTRERLQTLARDDDRIRVLAGPPRGIATALNEGLAAARGEFVARMDADDESLPERLATQRSFLCEPENADVGLVGCQVQFGGNPATGRGYALHVEWVNSLHTPEAIALNRFVESPFAHPSVMFRRELVARFGGYRAGDFPEDYELWLRWLDAGVKMAKVPGALLRWNDPPARLSRTDARYSPEAFFRLKAAWIAREVERLQQRDRTSAVGSTGSRQAGEGTADRLSGQARRPLFVWGAGRPTRKRAAHLEGHGLRIDGYVDVDLKKTTRALGGVGVPVIAPLALPSPGEVFVLGYVSTRGAREEIRAELRARGHVEGADFLMCA